MPSRARKVSTAYDPARNAFVCYALAIRALRLKGIREGRFAPRPHDAEEMAAASQIRGDHGIETAPQGA